MKEGLCKQVKTQWYHRIPQAKIKTLQDKTFCLRNAQKEVREELSAPLYEIVTFSQQKHEVISLLKYLKLTK